MVTMNDDEEIHLAYDAAIEPVGESLRHFVRCHRALFPDELSIDRERFLICWLQQIVDDLGIDLERAVQSLHDDGLTTHDDPLFRINDFMRYGKPPDPRT
jgi:hypothetical protein